MMKVSSIFMKKFLIISVAIFVTDISFSQKSIFNDIENLIEKEKYNKALEVLKNSNYTNLSKFQKAQISYFTGICYYSTDKNDLAFEKLMNAKNLFVDIDSLKLAVNCYNYMDKALGAQNKPNLTLPIREKLLQQAEPIAKKINYWHGLFEIKRSQGAVLIQKENYLDAINSFKESLHYSSKTNDSLSIARSLQSIAACYQVSNKIDSAFIYYDDAESYFIKLNDITKLSHNYSNRGQLHRRKGEYKKAISYILKADSLPITINILKSKLIYYKNLAPCYRAINDFRNEAKYLKLIIKYNDSIKNNDQNVAIAEINEKYENEKLRADNFKIESKIAIANANEKIARTQKNTILVGGSIVLCITLVIVSLSLKNSRRKRLIALQEKELATQKNLTLLKEQEIISINAMVAGQEKERKRVAEDLHDNLGSVIATLKMHFDNLRLNRELKKVDQETLFDKTEGLIEETYQKVRNMAHAKNAGVIANQGLLVAVKLMAEKISSANSLKINVVDYGLDKPLENSLELAIFRIIQELTTNIIKHAQASQATINISHDEEDITVLIEDNGVGMNTSQIDVQKGMGLHSIKTRVEHLEGSFTIDSTPTKGTTIIINIPT